MWGTWQYPATVGPPTALYRLKSGAAVVTGQQSRMPRRSPSPAFDSPPVNVLSWKPLANRLRECEKPCSPGLTVDRWLTALRAAAR